MCFSNIHFNIILSSTPRYSEWPLPFSFSDQNISYISQLPHACYVPYPPYPPSFGYTDNIWWSEQGMKFIIVKSSPVSFLRPNIPLNIQLPNTLSVCSSLCVRHQVSHVAKITGKLWGYVRFSRRLDRFYVPPRIPSNVYRRLLPRD